MFFRKSLPSILSTFTKTITDLETYLSQNAKRIDQAEDLLCDTAQEIDRMNKDQTNAIGVISRLRQLVA